jgi:exopolyphosphatase/guanosine-5'-triphosphate,3'-diphosphate pyrophosphatase
LAALDVGSNTVHLLVATLEPEGLLERLHAVEMVNLGREVANRGGLGEELVASTASLVASMVEIARQQKVESIGLVATEAIRNAPDAADLVAAVRRLSGENLRVLTGEAEARLSYLGATAFKIHSGLPATVADIGGGSTELVQGRGTKPHNGTSLKLGSDQLLRLVEASDPLTEREQTDAAARVSMVLEAVPRGGNPGTVIATGGTASNLPVLLGTARPAEESADLGLRAEVGDPWTELTRADVERAVAATATTSSDEIAARTGLSPRRARLMAGGVLILVGLLDRYHAEEFTVTERGLRDGVLLALAAAGTRRAAQGG